LRKQRLTSANTVQFIYVKSSFMPALEEEIGALADVRFHNFERGAQGQPAGDDVPHHDRQGNAYAWLRGCGNAGVNASLYIAYRLRSKES
jgi:hypothetical protein